METLALELTAVVREAAARAGYADAPIPVDLCVPTNNPQHGDYQSNFAFRLGKALRSNPRQVAQQIVDALPDHPGIAGAEVAGPGFVNFRLNDAWLAENVVARARDATLGTPQPGAGQRMVIDYSSPNVAKRMHIGHLRSTVIGSAIDRLYRFLGWEVVADNHIGDWGTQFGKLIVAWRGWRDEAAYAADPIGELQRLYTSFGHRAEAEPALLEQARAETVKLQVGDPENRRLWEQFIAVSLAEFDAVYGRLGVRFDVTLGESFYNERLQPLVEELLADGRAVVNDGAVIVPLGDIEADLADKPMLVRKSDGGALYGTTDLATVEYRRNIWDPQRIVYVTDVRQQLHFRQVFAACKKLGWDSHLVHVTFGMLRLPDGGIVATRSGSGGSLNLLDVLDAAVAHARTVVDEKSQHLPTEERATIAEAVGTGAIRYADLSQNPQSDITFDWNKMLSLDGNTAPYLMYAYARCRSIFRRAGGDEGFLPGALVLEHPSERELAIAIARWPEAVLEAAETWRPNVLCDHLFGLANSFARFYGACRVLGEDVPAEVTQSRLSLVYATSRALALGLDLLGLRALERM
jgi:arginyl-tRNA synthetase